MAVAILTVVFGVPIVVAIVVVQVAVVVVPAPAGRMLLGVWLVGLIAVSCAVTFATQRALRRFLPLAVLFRLSLVFPDAAPNRFRLALRSHTLRSLVRRVEGADGPSSTEQECAERIVTAMARLNRHDRLTVGHSERVRAYSVMLGQELGLPQDDLDRLNWAALTHDIGKLDVPADLLAKPARPTLDEWTILRRHAGAARPYVEPLRPWLGDWVDAATQHHERWDGLGYPAGLVGTEISLAGRIVAIADAYDVMTAARSYKKPLRAERARAELTLNSGTQFDPDLVRAFLNISIGRALMIVGPLGALAQVPDLLRAPFTVATSSTTTVMGAAAISVGALTAATAPMAGEARPGEEISAPMVEEDEVIGAGLLEPSEDPVGDPMPDESGPASLPDPDDADDSTAGLVDSDETELLAPPGGDLIDVGPEPIEPSPTSLPIQISPPEELGPPSPPPAGPGTTVTETTSPATTTTNTTTTSSTLGPPAPFRAVDDAALTDVGTAVIVRVLDNDQLGDSGPDVPSLAIVDEPTNGTFRVVGRNLRYEPANGFVGVDSMTYRICSRLGECDTATVTVSVS